MTNLFIFNSDFRLADNPALFRAAENGESLVAMFIHNPKKWQDHNESDIKIAFQIEHLKNLSKKLAELNISCLLYTSPSPRDGLLSRMPSSA